MWLTPIIKSKYAQLRFKVPTQGQWIVTSGLKQGEQVVMVGGAKVKPDQVKAMPYVALHISPQPRYRPMLLPRRRHQNNRNK